LRVRVKIFIFIIVYGEEKKKKRSMKNHDDVRNGKVWNKPLMISDDSIKIRNVLEGIPGLL